MGVQDAGEPGKLCHSFPLEDRFIMHGEPNQFCRDVGGPTELLAAEGDSAHTYYDPNQTLLNTYPSGGERSRGGKGER